MRQNFLNYIFSVTLALLFFFDFTLYPEIIDRVVAVVNGKVLTQLALEEEKEFQKIISGHSSAPQSLASSQTKDEKLLDLMVEQSLIREQIRQYSEVEISFEEVALEIELLRKEWGGNEAFEVELKQRHLSMEGLKNRTRWQLQVLKFIDSRFRQFAVVEAKEISSYYEQIFLPELNQKKLAPPPQAEVEEKIRVLLLEEKVNQQLEEWLRALKQNASIQILK
jgi:hypothetical protein